MTSELELIEVEAVNQLPRTSGVYVISLKDEILYVGESVNLRRRVSENRHNKFLNLPGSSLRFVECKNHKEVERYLIETLKPSLNWKSSNHSHWRYRSLLTSKSVTELLAEIFDPVSDGLVNLIAAMKTMRGVA